MAKSSAPPAAIVRHGRPRSALRVLLVDDEDMVRRCTERVLSDFEVVSVAGGSEALRLLEKDSDFDAVLSDVMMPSMSGPELYVHCFERYPQLAQRFVFISGDPEVARDDLRTAVDSLGADQPPILLAKPSPREALLLALFAAAAHGAPRSGTYAAVEPLAVEVTGHWG